MIKAVRARTMALRAEKKALTLGLGDAAVIAQKIAESKKELNKEFRTHPKQGVRAQTSVAKRISKRQAAEEKLRQRIYNPKIKGLANVPGVTVDENGEIEWEELKRQIPGIEKMKKAHLPHMEGVIQHIKRIKERKGETDDYTD